MEPLSRLKIILLHIFLLIVGNAINGASAQECGPPTLFSATPEYNATSSNDPLVMNCAGATLPAMFKWEFNGNIVPSAIEYLYVVQSVMEGGVYRCGYDNIDCPGTVWSTGSVTVITQPVVSVSTGPVSVTQGDTVTVHCNATSGYPAPSITWYNGSGVSLGHISPLTVTAGSNDTLTCIATNTAGYAAGSIAITVISIPQTSSSYQSSTVAASSSIPPSTTVVGSSSTGTSISSSIPASSSQTSSTIVPTTSTSLYHSSSFSSASLTTSVPSIATSVLTPTSTVGESSGSLTTENIFGLVVTVVFLVFLLASLSFFFAVGIYWCKIVRSNKKIRKEKKKREDARKLLKEDIDGDDEEKMAATVGGVPPSTSYINEGFKQEGNDGGKEEEEEEEEESDDGSLTNIAIIPKVTIEGQQEVSATDHYVIKMEKKTKEETLPSAVTETAETSLVSNDNVPAVPFQVTAVVEEGRSDTEEEEDAPAAGDRDKPLARKPFLVPQELQDLVRNFETFHLEDNAKESIIGREYKDIPMLLQDMSIWPSDTYSKNRYRNVIPNKDTAVMLSGDTIADQYINANYINGHDGTEKAYICAQAPIYDTIPDFWRMIWECNVNTVVMLCGIFEGGKNKCAKYWPPPDTNDTEYYGPFTVRNNYEELLSFYKVVYLSLSINSEEAERDVMLFIFQGWPDFGVPEQAGPMLEFQEAVSINHTGGPLLVHCSAGVGRSGTYIAADIGIQQYNAEKTVDPYGTVVKLREQRGGMIQSFDQYAFLHIVLANYISRNQ